jgi:hypothetical protein
MSDKYRLWTPVANALDVYRRRILADPPAIYEHLWRLIHIHEALAVTLGAGLATRLLDIWKGDVQNKSRLDHLRSMITGLPEKDGEAISETRTRGYCLGGSIQAWVDLLQHFGKSETMPSCPFCHSVAHYLAETAPEGKLAFLDSWKRLAPVPSVYTHSLPRVKRFDAINSLRNKLAHVPLPSRVLPELHRGLRREIFSALSADAYEQSEDSLDDFRTVKWHTPLRGLITSASFSVTGSDTRKTDRGSDQAAPVRIQPDSPDEECWFAEPFFLVDGECKVSLLFRVPDEIDGTSDNYRGEYHRFAAEFEPVNAKDIHAQVMEPWLPQSEPTNISGQPQEDISEQSTSEESSRRVAVELSDESRDPDTLRSIAEEAYRSRNYGKAIRIFAKLAATGDTYCYNDVARLHHGSSLWRYAYANRDELKETRLGHINDAVHVLEGASEHVDARYSARAWYEMSKAYHKLWKLTGDGYFDRAYQAAEEAAKRDYQMAYITWIERLDEEKSQFR